MTEEVKRFCETCGSEVSETAKFCGKCGTSVSEYRPETDAHNSAQEQNSDRRSAKNWVLPVLVLVSLILLVIGGLVFSSLSSSERVDVAGSSESDEPFEPQDPESAAECLQRGDHIDLAGETAEAIVDLGNEAQVAATAGSQSALREASRAFASIHGPEMSRLSRSWEALDSCGDSVVANFQNDISGELETIGDILSGYQFGDTTSLLTVIESMDKTAQLSGDYADYVLTLE